MTFTNDTLVPLSKTNSRYHRVIPRVLMKKTGYLQW